MEKKISVYNLYTLYIIALYNPSVRLMPRYAARVAKQAAWLGYIIPFFIMMGLYIMFHDIYKKHKNKSLSEIIFEITGRITGKLIVSVYGFLTFVLVCLYLRYFAENITSTIMPDTNINVLLIFILLILAFTARKGLVPVSRMNAYFFIYHVITYSLVVILGVIYMRPDNLFPVSTKDIIPVLKSGMAFLPTSLFVVPFFFLSKYIRDTENIKKHGFGINIFLYTCITFLMLSTIGVFGYPFVTKLPLPFLALAKQISIFKVIEKAEAFVVMNLFLAYFETVVMFIFIILEITKSLFKLKETKNILNPFMVLIYFMCALLASTRLELEVLSEKIIVPATVIIFLGLTVIIYVIGKIRKVV